jgi:hypothetical protein
MTVRRALRLGVVPCAAVLLMGCGLGSARTSSTGTPAAACNGSLHALYGCVPIAQVRRT